VYEGYLYRFLNKNNPVLKDFQSYYASKPTQKWGNKACQARGLSVYQTLDDCKEMIAAVPAMRRKKIASALSNVNYGLLANTPSTTSERHCTWWVPSDFLEPHKKFTIVETRELANV
jgi:hypothetical protein